MGHILNSSGLNAVFDALTEEYEIYGPVLFQDGGRFSDTDSIRYNKIKKAEDLVLNKKAEYSFKEVLLPITQTLFYFTEEAVKESDEPQKGAVIFLRSCDLHGVKRLDEMYLNNGATDPYYKRIRDKVKFIVMGCGESCENGFCVDMQTNIPKGYDASIDSIDGLYYMDSNWDKLSALLCDNQTGGADVQAQYVTENNVKVNIPKNLNSKVASSSIWEEYNGRCINCGTRMSSPRQKNL